MNKVLLYWKKTSEDEAWAIQFTGDDPSLVSEYAPAKNPPGTTLPDFPIRKRVAITTAAPTWAALMRGVDASAALAGRDGLVFLLGGHGGSACVDDNDHIDPRCRFKDVGTVFFDPDSRLGFNQDIVTYRNTKAELMNSSLHDVDMKAILSRTPGLVRPLGKKHHTTAAQRWEAWNNYDRIGKILRYRQIHRIVFLSCSLGGSPDFMDGIAEDWGVQVAAFKSHVTVIPPETFPDRKARFVFKHDIKTPGQGTNIPSARVFTPSLDDSALAYVAQPPRIPFFFDLEVLVPFPGPGNRYGTMSEWRQMNRVGNTPR
jgi:hypothetical protein